MITEIKERLDTQISKLNLQLLHPDLEIELADGLMVLKSRAEFFAAACVDVSLMNDVDEESFYQIVDEFVTELEKLEM